MKINLNWLKQYVSFDLDASRLVEVLDSIGLLVDHWEDQDGDVVLDLETYANRPDTLGHLGVARELAAALDIDLLEQEWPLTESSERTSDLADVQIWEEDLCPRYCGLIVKNIKVGPSPDWLRQQIESMGLKPVNNVVDVTNFVLFATAHPIHAFDLAKIGGGKIIIRKANKGERLLDLEGRDVVLSTDHLVIADGKKPIALAGIIGGEATAVSGETRDVFIESAYFDPVSIRLTSKDSGIQTDASYRFERGADLTFPPQAARMAASLLTQMGGKVTREIIDVFPKPHKARSVVLRHHRITELLGVEVDVEFVVRVLSRLGFRMDNQQPDIWQVHVPSFRVDIEREADLIEEVARFFGYDKIPARVPPFEVLEPARNPRRRSLDRIREVLLHYGFDEVVNFSFADPEKEAKFKTALRKIEIKNPISSKASQLRTTLLGGLCENILWNRNRGAERVHIFESGNIYFWDQEVNRERLTLALASSSWTGGSKGFGQAEEADFFHLKGACESLMAYLRYEPLSFKEDKHPIFAKGYALSLEFKGETVGHLGLLKKDVTEAFGLKDPVWAAEVDLEGLFQKQPRPFAYTPVAKYPSVSRDLTFIASRSTSYQRVEEAIQKLALSHLEKFTLYDRFSGASIPKGKVSLALRFVFRHPQRTLLAREVEQYMRKIITTLDTKLGFKLREGGKIDI